MSSNSHLFKTRGLLRRVRRIDSLSAPTVSPVLPLVPSPLLTTSGVKSSRGERVAFLETLNSRPSDHSTTCERPKAPKMTRRGGREQAPSERNESFPHTRANDQAALCLTGGDVYNNRNEQSSTRYIMSGNDVPHAVTFTPTSLQQMRTGFLNPADDEGLPFAQHVDQEDEFFMQPSSVQVQSDADWQYTADEHAWSRYRYPEMPFAEPWSSANQQTGADSSLLDTNEWREDTLRGINEPAEMELEVSMNFDTDPHQDFLISDPPFAGNPNTPPWSIYTQNCLELQQLQQGLTTPVNGPRTSAVSCSTRTEDTPESSFVIVDPAGMSSMSSLSHCEEDMAGSNLTIHPNRQTHGNFDCWFKHTASDQMNASATQDLQTPLAERGRPQTALDPRSVDQSLA